MSERPRSSAMASPTPSVSQTAPHAPPLEAGRSIRPRPQTFSIFFPMYNELQNMPQVLDQAEEVLPTLGFVDWEILVVDDGSKDGSAELVERRAQQNPHIRLVRHQINQGYGAALRTGFTEAKNELVFYTDSDLPVHLSLLREAIPRLYESDSDLLIGYRLQRFETTRRAIYSRIYNQLVRQLFDVHVRDVNFSFKLVRREVLSKIRLSAGTVFIDGQLLAEARKNGFRIAEMPIEYTPRRFGVSSFDSPKVALLTLREILGYRLTR